MVCSFWHCLHFSERFLFGNLLPDCVDSSSGRKGAKASSHFWEIDSRREARGQNWHLFWDNYERYRKDELYLVYMCHLVTDAIWVKNVIVPLKEANGGCHFRTTEILYRDYHPFAEKGFCLDCLKKLRIEVKYIGIEEVDVWIMKKIKKQANDILLTQSAECTYIIFKTI